LIKKNVIGGRRQDGGYAESHSNDRRLVISRSHSGRRRTVALPQGKQSNAGDARAAMLRAKLMARDKANAGSVAFSRRRKSDLEEFEAAVILKVFGKVPKDFDIG
jgi:hypothetical protein